MEPSMTATEARRRLALIPARLFLAAALAFAGFAVIGVAIAQDSPGGPGGDDGLPTAPDPDDEGGSVGPRANCNLPNLCPKRSRGCPSTKPHPACCNGPTPQAPKTCDCFENSPSPAGCTDA